MGVSEGGPRFVLRVPYHDYTRSHSRSLTLKVFEVDGGRNTHEQYYSFPQSILLMM